MNLRNYAVEELLGYAWLQRAYDLDVVAQLDTVSLVGRARNTHVSNGLTEQIYQRTGRSDTLQSHLGFALKHEGVHLELLARLFAKVDPAVLTEWLTAEPQSQYARRAGFFYEWLTAKRLPISDTPMTKYIDAIDPNSYLHATVSTPNRRWRVNDNLPGTPAFCPMIKLGSKVQQDATSLDVQEHISSLARQYGQEMLLRAVNWLTIKESRSSFEIEHEGKEEDRIHRFARAMTQYCGKIDDPLSLTSLHKIQDAILGDKVVGFTKGLRRSPVFVGHIERYTPVVDYIAPSHEQIESMLAGLRTFSQKTVRQNSVLRAAALSFGFVYIHPMADGNGRISRFLINDTLRRDGVVPSPLILPISAIISASLEQRTRYNEVLETVSIPLMRSLDDGYAFASQRMTYADGVESNFVCEAYGQAEASWKYLELSPHASFTTEIVRRSVVEGVGEEAKYLRNFDRARMRLGNEFEARREDLDTIVRSIVEDSGVSKKLQKNYPQLFSDPLNREHIVRTVLESFVDPQGNAPVSVEIDSGSEPTEPESHLPLRQAER